MPATDGFSEAEATPRRPAVLEGNDTPVVTVEHVESFEALKQIADEASVDICHYRRAEGEDVFFLLANQIRYQYVAPPTPSPPLHPDHLAVEATRPLVARTTVSVKPERRATVVRLRVADRGEGRSPAERRRWRLPQRLTGRGGLVLVIAGVILLAWVGWLTWHDLTLWGKDASRSLLESRVAEPMSLGLDVRGIHYLLAGEVLLTLGLIAARGPLRRWVGRAMTVHRLATVEERPA